MLNMEGAEGLMVSLDAKKAFDSVDHVYIEKCLGKFGCSRFIPIFKTLYRNLATDIIINGRVTPGFKILRGVKQGDALSCVLFIMCMEPLLKNIEINQNIKAIRPISLNCELPKVYAYADDVNCIAEDSEACLQNVFIEYDRLTSISGLELNADKTEIMKLGTNVEGRYKIRYQQRDYELNSVNKMKVNGILLQRNKHEMVQSNVDSVIARMDSHFKNWSRRGLSLMGKILIAKTFGISQLIYLLQSMSLTDAHFKKINMLLYKFIWNRHYLAAKAPDRIKRTILTTPILLGGFGMLDVVELDNSLKLRAVGRVLKSDHPFNKIVKDRIDLKAFFKPKCHFEWDSVCCQGIDLLRVDRIRLWEEQGLDNDKNLLAAIRDVNIRDIITLRGQGSISFFQVWMRGVRKVKDLNEHDLDKLQRHIKPELMSKLRTAIRYNIPALAEDFLSMYRINKIYKPLWKPSSKEFRENRKNKVPITSFKIGLDLEVNECLTWCHRIKRLTSTCHKNTILKTAHGDVYTQERLHRFGLTDTNTCPRCDETETLRHKVIECRYVAMIWAQVELISIKLGNQVDAELNATKKILGASKENNLASLTLRAEILNIILRLKTDQNYLVHPKQLVLNAVKGLSIKEGKTEIKRLFINALEQLS